MNIQNEPVPEEPRRVEDYQTGFAREAAPVVAGSEVAQSIPPRGEVWSDVFLAFGVWLLSVIFVAIIPVLVALPYLMARYWGTQQNPGQAIMGDPTALLLSVLGVFPAHALTFAVAWVVVTRYGKRPFWRTMGWSFGQRFGLLASIGLAVALYLVGGLVADKIGGTPTDIEALINSSTAVRIALAVLAATTGPFVEEIIYRGIIYTALEKAIGVIGSVVIVAFLFALVHVYQYRTHLGVILAVTILSLSLTLVRAYTGRLLPCFIIHMVFNGIQSVLIVLQPYLKQFEHDAEPQKQVGLLLWRALRLMAFRYGL